MLTGIVLVAEMVLIVGFVLEDSVGWRGDKVQISLYYGAIG